MRLNTGVKPKNDFGAKQSWFDSEPDCSLWSIHQFLVMDRVRFSETHVSRRLIRCPPSPSSSPKTIGKMGRRSTQQPIDPPRCDAMELVTRCVMYDRSQRRERTACGGNQAKVNSYYLVNNHSDEVRYIRVYSCIFVYICVC